MGGWFLRAEVRCLCLDKGYDCLRVSEEVYVNGFEEHIRSREEEVRGGRRNPARRWVVERTLLLPVSFGETLLSKVYAGHSLNIS